LEQRLRSVSRAAAARYRAGLLTLDDLRTLLRQELARALAAAVLVGAGGRRSADVDALVRTHVERAWDELDALLALVEDGSVSPEALGARLDAFDDFLDRAREDGEALVEREAILPIAVGAGAGAAALALLARRIGRAPAQVPMAQVPMAQVPGARAVTLPRVDAPLARALTQRFGADLDSLVDRFIAGEIDALEWHAAMRDQLRTMHSAYYRLGRGGSLAQSDLARLEARLAQQYQFLEAWRDELAAGRVPNAAAMRARARLYLNAGNASLQDGRSAAIGLPPLPAVPGDGTTICRANCKCTWQIVSLPGEGNFDCYWRLRPAEHCPTCEARAAAWFPIRARGGEWEAFPTLGLFE